MDVSKISEKIRERSNEKYLEGFEKIITQLDNTKNDSISQQAVLLHGIVTTLKASLEQFTVELIQEVVDRLEQADK